MRGWELGRNELLTRFEKYLTVVTGTCREAIRNMLD